MKHLIITILVFLTIFSQGYTQEFQWAKGMGGKESESLTGFAIDKLDNVYVTGSFKDTAYFGEDTLTATGTKAFLAIYSKAGDVKSIRAYDKTVAVATDEDNNYIVCFAIPNQFQPPGLVEGVHFQYPYGSFLVKYSPTGAQLWIKQIYTNPNVTGILRTDPSGNIYLMQSYIGSYSDYFFTLYKIDKNGNTVWLKSSNQDGYDNYCADFQVDPMGNIYLAGEYPKSKFTFSTFSTTGTYEDNLFVMKLDPSGTMSWVYKGGYSGNYGYTSVQGLTLDNWGNVYVVGIGECFWPSFFGYTDYFFKLNTDGVFVKQNSLSNYCDGSYNKITSNKDGDIYLFGLHNCGSTRLTKFNANLTEIWTLGISGEENSYSDQKFIRVDDDNSIYIAGNTMKASITFGPFTITNRRVNSVDLYLYKVLEKFNVVTGKIFLDANANGIQDASEMGLSNQKVKIMPGSVFLNTDSNGVYKGYLSTGNFQISAVPYKTWQQSAPVSPLYHTANFTQFSVADSQNHFGFVLPANTTDVSVAIGSTSIVRPGREVISHIYYGNEGGTTESGTIKLVSDPQLIYVSSIPSYSSVSGDTLIWNYATLAPLETKGIKIKYTTDQTTQVNDTIESKVFITASGSDVVPNDNQDTLYQIARTSYDPNQKTVYPSGTILPSTIAAGQKLYYTIQFQNTGNDTAFVVRIRDTLSTNLNIETLKVMHASHPYTYKIAGRTLIFTFDNILLPDSTTDEPGSHGYVTFNLEANRSLLSGSSIVNTSYIYFDYNVPVKTNNATVYINESVLSIHAGKSAEHSIDVYPNPASDHVFVAVPEEFKNSILYVYDAFGKLILTKEVNAALVNVDLQDFSNGMYFIELSDKDTGKSARQKLLHLR